MLKVLKTVEKCLKLVTNQFRFSGKMSAAPISPSLKDLPKVNTDLKSQLECFNQKNLKDVDTLEKNILPSAQGMFVSVYIYITFNFLDC